MCRRVGRATESVARQMRWRVGRATESVARQMRLRVGRATESVARQVLRIHNLRFLEKMLVIYFGRFNYQDLFESVVIQFSNVSKEECNDG